MQNIQQIMPIYRFVLKQSLVLLVIRTRKICILCIWQTQWYWGRLL